MAVITTFKNIQDRVLDLLSKSDATTRNRVKNWINLGQTDFIMREDWPFRSGADFPTDLADTELIADSDETLIPLEYRECLVHYALSLEHDFNTDPDLAQKATNRYEQIVTLARNNLLAHSQKDYEITGVANTWTDLGGKVIGL